MPGSTQSDRLRAEWAQTPAEQRAARTAPARAAQRFYAAERYVQRLVSTAPPLSDEQRTRLAAILAPAREESVA